MGADARVPARARPLNRAVLIGGVALGAALVAVRFFPEAVPQVALQQQLTPEIARARAAAFVRAHHLPATHARTAVRFATIDSLQVFLELGAGGKDTLASVVRGRDVTLFRWWVRYFTPGDPREVRIRLTPDGRVVQFIRELAKDDRRPALDSVAALALADSVLAQWMGLDPARWTLQASSYTRVKESDRLDRTFTYERTDRRIAGAPLRFDVVIAGDLPTMARDYVVIPEAFLRRYAEMRASNDLFAFAGAFGFAVYGLMALVAVAVFARRGLVRWRPAMIASTVIAGLYGASMANAVPGNWYGYATATPPGLFLVTQVLAVLITPVVLALFMIVVIAGGEVLVRRAFPAQLDWWSVWRGRGTRAVAGQVLSGYALCAVGFGYVSLFYFVTQHAFGWWVPSELLDDPNQIATPLPWVSAVAQSLQAGVLEEILFRAVPLSLLALLIKDHPARRWVLGVGAVVTALVFGFAHANYASWPPYSRGVELFAEALLWALIFLRYGLVTTVVSHFVYDLLLFGLFAAAGTAPAYRATLGVVLLAALAPAAMVFSGWARRRRFEPASDDLLFDAWRPDADSDAESSVGAPVITPMMDDALPALPAPSAPPAPRWHIPDLRWPLIVVAVALVFPVPAARVLGPPFTVNRARAIADADAVLARNGVDTSEWTRLATIETFGGGATERFFRAHDARALEQSLAASYRPSAAWRVRYVHRDGSLDRRAEQWEVRLLPNGALLDVAHAIADSAPRPATTTSAARAAAVAALRANGIAAGRLLEVEVTNTDRPRRRDVSIEYADTAIHMPGGASALVRVDLAGPDVLSLSRRIELPEAFLRADRARREELGVATGVSALVLLTLLFACTVWMVRRQTPTMDDATLSTRGMAIAVAICVAGLFASAVNATPTVYADWDTATPWQSFVAMRWLTVTLQSLGVVLIAAFWIAADALRRRIGIPFRLPATAPVGIYETLLSGAALAALPFVVMRGGALWGPDTGSWDAPETHLAALVPAVDAAIGIIRGVFMAPVVVALPAMVVFGVAHRPGWRLVAPLIAAALLTAPVIAEGDLIADEWAVGAIAVLVAVLVAAYPVVRWGRQSVAAWVAAWFAFGVFSNAALASSAAASGDRASAIVAVGVSAAGLVAVWAYLRRH